MAEQEKQGSLIQVLHMAQGIYGYLPIEVQKRSVNVGYPKPGGCKAW